MTVRQGAIKSHQKISDTAGGFTGGHDDLDEFGSAVTDLGDLDGPGGRIRRFSLDTGDQSQDGSDQRQDHQRQAPDGTGIPRHEAVAVRWLVLALWLHGSDLFDRLLEGRSNGVMAIQVDQSDSECPSRDIVSHLGRVG